MISFYSMYIGIGIIVFTLLAWTSLGDEPVAPAWFYTLGLILVVFMWPLFVLDAMESWDNRR